jgi:O-antigen ligase
MAERTTIDRTFFPGAWLTATGRGFELLWALVAVVGAVSIALVDPATALTIVLFAFLLIVSLSTPAIGLSVLVATVPLQETWPAQLGSMELTWTRVAFAALLFAWAARFALGREEIRLNGLTWALAAYCAALMLSIVHARNIDAWAEESYRWLVAAAVFVIAVSIARTAPDCRTIIIGLMLGVVLSFGVASYQVITATGPATFNERGFLRAYGFFGEPNPFAGYLEMATLPLLAVGATLVLSHDRGQNSYRVAALIVGVLGCLALAMTQSRGGVLGLTAGLAVLWAILWPHWGRRMVAIGIIGAIVAIWLPQAAPIRAAFGFDSLFESASTQVTPANWAAQERLAHWGAAIKMWESYPWTGIGAGNFSDYFRELTPVWRFRISRGHAHSAYLQAASQAGIMGLLCFLAVLCAAWVSCLRAIPRASSGARRAECVGALAVTAAVAVHGLFDYLHVLSLGIVLSAVWAMSFAEEGIVLSESVRHAGD